MNALLFRTRVAVLWVGVAIAMAASLLLHVYKPGAVEELLVGEMEGETLTEAMGFLFAAIGIFPVLMAAVALLVVDRVNCRVNAIAGTVFGFFGVFAVVGHIVEGGFTVHVLMVAVAGALAFLIAGLGWVELRRATPRAGAPKREQSRPREEVTV